MGTISPFGVEAVTTHFRHLLFGFAVLLTMSSPTIAQPPIGTVKTLTLKSSVLGEERTVLVRTPVGVTRQ